MADEQPKIIVDDDWKSEAQAEKAKLAEQEAQKKADAPEEGGSPGVPGAPVASFEELVRMFAVPALMYMGQMPDPQTGQAVVSLEVAKLHIDLLGVLEEKTKGNLAEDEQQLISGTANELRLAYVEISKAVQQAVAEGKLKPQSVGGMGGAPGGADLGGGMPGGPLTT